MKRFARWFVISGGVGVATVVALYVLSVLTLFALSPYVLFALAPGMILLLADPTSIGSNLLFLGIILGTNFVLYGLLGMLLCWAWSRFRRGTKRA